MEATFIPFNHDPTANDYGNTSRNYTPAVGKYAIVTITLSVSAFGLAADVDQNDSVAWATTSSDSAVITVRLDTGEQITSTATSASSTTGVVSSGNTSSHSVATVSVGGNKVSEIRAYASAGHRTTTTDTSTVSGFATVNYSISEYNVVS